MTLNLYSFINLLFISINICDSYPFVEESISLSNSAPIYPTSIRKEILPGSQRFTSPLSENVQVQSSAYVPNTMRVERINNYESNFLPNHNIRQLELQEEIRQQQNAINQKLNQIQLETNNLVNPIRRSPVEIRETIPVVNTAESYNSRVLNPSYVSEQRNSYAPRQYFNRPENPSVNIPAYAKVTEQIYENKAIPPVQFTSQKVQTQSPIISNEKIKDVVANTKFQKRYMILHPDGTIEHVDELEPVANKYPNYRLVNAGKIFPKREEPQMINPVETKVKAIQETEANVSEIMEKLPKIEINHTSTIPHEEKTFVSANTKLETDVKHYIATTTPKENKLEIANNFPEGKHKKKDDLPKVTAVKDVEIRKQETVSPTETGASKVTDTSSTSTTNLNNVEEEKLTTKNKSIESEKIYEKNKELKEVKDEKKQESKRQEDGLKSKIDTSYTHEKTDNELSTHEESKDSSHLSDVFEESGISEKHVESSVSKEVNEKSFTASTDKEGYKKSKTLTHLDKEEDNHIGAEKLKVTEEERRSSAETKKHSIDYSKENHSLENKESHETEVQEIAHHDMPDTSSETTQNTVMEEPEKPSEKTEYKQLESDDSKTHLEKSKVVSEETSTDHSQVTIEKESYFKNTEEKEESTSTTDSSSEKNHNLHRFLSNDNVNIGKPAVWFRTSDMNFWDKLITNDQNYEVIYFFQVAPPPIIEKDTKVTVYPNGTVVEDVIQTVWDAEEDMPKVTKTRKVIEPK